MLKLTRVGPLKKKSVRQGFFEFIKLQVAGNIPFWVTYSLFALLDKVFYANDFWALLVSTITAYALFFLILDIWVFSASRKRRSKPTEVWRFVIFTGFSALLVFNLNWFLSQQLGIDLYIAQFITAALSITWTFPGYKFWVFAPARKFRILKR